MSSDGRCDSCERFIGGVDTCPYCSEANQSSGSRIFRWLAVVFAVSGLCVLALTPLWSEVPLITSDEITPLMNFAHVRMEGNVEKPPYTGKHDGVVDYLSFSLNDGSGTVRVVAYDGTARSLANDCSLLEKGSRVSVTGVLTVKAGRARRLTLRDAEGVEREGQVASGEWQGRDRRE
jgi:hypothetical protein